MKLNKDTKLLLAVGDYLKDGANTYIIKTIIPSYNNGLNVTLQDIKTNQNIYLIPSSQCYGMEIIKGD